MSEKKGGRAGGSSRPSRGGRVQGTNFRWVVPRLSSQVWGRKQAYKAELLDRLRASKTARKGIRHYSIAIESHADGAPHLDLLLIFEKRVGLYPTELDFLCQKHGDLTKYRTLNAAILNYGLKQDAPLTNLTDPLDALHRQSIVRDSYVFFQQRMLNDPYGFDLAQFCAEHDYFRSIRGFRALESKLKTHQEAICNLRLQSKPGIRFIDEALITSTLTPSQLELYQSWPGYARIVGFINQISTYGFSRPFKTPNLMLVGPPNVGKTSLVLQLMRHTAVYPVGTQNWFPKFKNRTYHVMFWDEWIPSMMPWEALLMLFQGLPMDLPYKGGSVLKHDNQLWIMTHNQTLESHVTSLRRFLGTEGVSRSIAAMRARVTEIVVPDTKPLFILQRLIVPLE